MPTKKSTDGYVPPPPPKKGNPSQRGYVPPPPPKGRPTPPTKKK